MSEVVLAFPILQVNQMLPEGFSNTLSRAAVAGGLELSRIWADRAALKAGGITKQVIDYGVFVILGGEGNPDLISLYQRGKTVGEEMLMGNYSVGYGGHPEKNKDRVTYGEVPEHPEMDGSLDLRATLIASRNREEGEEITITYTGELAGKEPEHQKYVHLGWINDNSNDIGRCHFAAVSVAVLPEGTVITSNEPNQVIRKPSTLAELREPLEGGVLENWSRFVVDALAPMFNEQGKLTAMVMNDPDTGDEYLVAEHSVEPIEGDA